MRRIRERCRPENGNQKGAPAMDTTVTMDQLTCLAASVVRRVEAMKKEKEKKEHAKRCSAQASN